MFKYTLLIIFLAVIVVEIGFYRQYVKKWKSKLSRRMSVGWSFFISVFTLSLGLVFGFGNPHLSALMIWVIWFFLLNFGVKLLLVLFGIGGVSWLRKTGVALSALFAGVMILGLLFGRTILRVERVEIVSERVPEALDGYKIVQFSDVHLGNMSLDGGLLRRMVERINSLEPDLIVQTGDLFNLSHREMTEEYRDILSRLQARDGVVAVFGNHDLGLYLSENSGDTPYEVFKGVRKAQEELGWRLLENDHFYVYRNGDSIAVAGVMYPKDRYRAGSDPRFGSSNMRATMGRINDSTFTVLLSHTPTLFDSIPAVGRPDLMLSGHVHAMQMKFGNWSPAKWAYSRYSGRYEKEGSALYVNDGIGYVLYPFRFGANPEITEIVLRHKPSKR